MRVAAVSCCSTAPRTTASRPADCQSAFSSRSWARAIAKRRTLIALSASASPWADRMLWRTIAVTMVSMFFMRWWISSVSTAWMRSATSRACASSPACFNIWVR